MAWCKCGHVHDITTEPGDGPFMWHLVAGARHNDYTKTMTQPRAHLAFFANLYQNVADLVRACYIEHTHTPIGITQPLDTLGTKQGKQQLFGNLRPNEWP